MRWLEYKTYYVSECGHIRNKNGRTVHPYLHKSRNTRYLRASLKGEKIFVHVLVYLLFNGPIPEGHQVDHIDHNQYNNHYTNLMTRPHRENQSRKVKFNPKLCGHCGREKHVVSIGVNLARLSCVNCGATGPFIKGVGNDKS